MEDKNPTDFHAFSCEKNELTLCFLHRCNDYGNPIVILMFNGLSHDKKALPTHSRIVNSNNVALSIDYPKHPDR
jgi:hypothetical protein